MGPTLDRAFVESLPGVLWEYDPARERCTFMSPRIEALVGIPAARWLEEPALWMGRIHEEDREVAVEACRAATERGEECDVAYRMLASDGRVVHVRSIVRVVHGPGGLRLRGVLVDETSFREAEAARARAEEGFRVSVEHAPDYVVVSRELRTVYLNAAMRRLRGLGDEARPDLDVLSLVHPDDRARVVERHRLAAARAGVPLEELRFVDGEGRARLGEVHTVGIAFEGAPAVLTHIRDVTHERELRARLELAGRVASAGALAAGIAHEINNPLSYVLVNLESARRTLAAPARDGRADVDALLADAHEGARRIARIVGDMRALARSGEATVGPVDVRGAAEAALRLTERQLAGRARVSLDAPSAILALAEEGGLCQVLVNLLVNAAQALPDAGSARHRVEVVVREREPGGRVEIEVRDDGPGIPEHLQRRVFEPFFTTKRPGEGTGLGLAICESYLKGWGGRIELDSRPGAGATFRLLLRGAA